MKKINTPSSLRVVILCAVTAQTIGYSSLALASCGASFCLVNTDWVVQGAWLDRGNRLDLRYEQVRQDQLMSGSRKLAANEVDLRNREVETTSHRWLLNVDHGINEHWGISASIPFIDRSHLHTEAGAPVTWNFRQIGDARLSARYQSALQDTATGGGTVFGANAGLKLATGKTDIANDTGTRAERSLQPGTGTTDLVASVYYRRVLADLATSWFVQANLEAPLNEKDGYKPGKKFGLDLGIRTEWSRNFSPMLQLNFQSRERDSGFNAEPENSGGDSLSISPGLSYKLAGQAHIYGFVQIPLHQRVNGEQLSPKWAATIGIQSTF
ncbi:hypothetical protein [Undibacterium sp. KW1]|uniref:hypothetical protein n=1 Tax=Undibacterium sp. KW1 TaxID=2058624 RepID=UPI00138A1979|nr:hypothetical protein [Undibacterium sp. KW1]